MFYLRWYPMGPLGGDIDLESAAYIFRRTVEQIRKVLDNDKEEHFILTSSNDGRLLLRAKTKSNRRGGEERGTKSKQRRKRRHGGEERGEERETKSNKRRKEPQVEATVEISECPICYKDLTRNEFVTLCCKHKYCVPCCQKIEKCSLCRAPRSGGPASTLLDLRSASTPLARGTYSGGMGGMVASGAAVTPDGFNGYVVDDSSDSEGDVHDSSDSEGDVLMRPPMQQNNGECAHCARHWVGWQCRYCS